MKTKTIDELLDDLKPVLDFVEIKYPETDDTVLILELKSAIGEINRCRRFTPTQDVLYDIKYEDKIIPLVVAAMGKTGAEGQTTHVENDTSRQYGSADRYPPAMLRDIIPLTKWG